MEKQQGKDKEINTWKARLHGIMKTRIQTQDSGDYVRRATITILSY